MYKRFSRALRFEAEKAHFIDIVRPVFLQVYPIKVYVKVLTTLDCLYSAVKAACNMFLIYLPTASVVKKSLHSLIKLPTMSSSNPFTQQRCVAKLRLLFS